MVRELAEEGEMKNGGTDQLEGLLQFWDASGFCRKLQSCAESKNDLRLNSCDVGYSADKIDQFTVTGDPTDKCSSQICTITNYLIDDMLITFRQHGMGVGGSELSCCCQAKTDSMSLPVVECLVRTTEIFCAG